MSRTIAQLFSLAGRNALITGGSRGLGLQIAHALGEAGARVLIASRKPEELERATQDLRAAGVDADWLVADCANEHDLRALGQQALQRLGRVDVLVNNAGVLAPIQY